MDEQDLIRRSAAGDGAAFEALVERKRTRVFWIAYHVLGDSEAARDVAQEVFLRLYRSLGRFRAGASFDAWLHRMTLNLAIDARRRERPHRETASLDDLPEPASAPEGSPAGSPSGATGRSGESPAAGTLRQREVRRIFNSLASLLAPKQRFAFILREIEGMSTAEVAAILQTSESTVRNHILQARRILQRELRRRYPEYCRPPDRREE